MTLIYLCIGFLVGLFIPSPFDTFIKSWVSTLWGKIFKKVQQ